LARKKSPTLTEAELRLMNIIWEKGRATVGEVVKALESEPPLAYSTVLTTLRILEQKGCVSHTQEGRAYVYEPLIDRQQARHSALQHVISRFFNNSPELLVLNVLEHEELDAQELERLKAMIRESES
jgi:predicted transcriptional regulator